MNGTNPETITARLATATDASDAPPPVPRNQGWSAPPLKPLTPSKLNQIAFASRDGKADPDEVREALKLFYRHAEARKPIPPRLIEFVAESFGRYLGYRDVYGPDERRAKSLDSAFGLLRKKGRPEADDELRMKMAAEVVRLRLSGTPHQEALDRTAEDFGWERTIVGKAFRDHLASAVAMNRIERPAPLTPEEKRRLAKMLRHQSKIESGKIAD
jgi:hypothetical protein